MADRLRLLPDPPELLKAIEAKSAEVREAAASLTASVQTLCTRLAKIPGRVEARHFGKHPSDGDLELGLWFHKVGKEWIVSYCEFDSQTASQHEEYSPDWEPLTEAPMKFIAAAVPLFPSLLNAIKQSQDKLVKQYRQAEAEAKSLIAQIEETRKEAGK